MSVQFMRSRRQRSHAATIFTLTIALSVVASPIARAAENPSATAPTVASEQTQPDPGSGDRAPVPIPADVASSVAGGPTEVLISVDTTPATTAIHEIVGAGSDPTKLQAASVAAAAVYADQKATALGAVTGVQTVREFGSLPVQLVKVDSTAALTALATAPGVSSIVLPRTYQPAVDTDLTLIHQPEAQQAGFTGAGVVVAVIDTGVDYTRTGSAAAFGNCAAGPGTGTCRIDHFTDVSGTGQLDTDSQNHHGTNVSGIVAKTAPGAHLDVYGVFNSTASEATDGDILGALNLIAQTGAARGVRAVNLSIQDGTRVNTECPTSIYAGPFVNLRALGILPVLAAGNAAVQGGSYQSGVSSIACAPGAMRVGAVYPTNQTTDFNWGICTDHTPRADQIACFSQGGALVSVLAPGVGSQGAGLTLSGTSQAAPHVAAAVADLADANPGATIQQIARALASTGRSTRDARDNTTVNRLDIAAAAVAVQAPAAEIVDPNCAANSVPRGTDTSSPSVPLPFTADFYGTTYQSLFVNNNGNVTFLNRQASYTPFVIGASTPPIIAPFFADVDTRGVASQLVTYGVTSYGSRTAFCVNWNGVGYFNSHTDKLNSFQLLLVDRGDVGAGNFDIVMNYGSLNWESGDGSGAANGFNGTPAGGGFSAGDGQADHFFQFPASRTHLGFLDANNQTGLVNKSRGSLQNGRYIFTVRNGLPPGSGTISGSVTDTGGTPQALAPVEACPVAGGACVVGFTGNDGRYAIIGLTPGQWNLTISPAAGSSRQTRHAGAQTVATGTVTTADVVLTGPTPPPAGTTITNHGTSGGVPVIYWNDALALTTAGCAGGTASYRVDQGATTLRSGDMAETSAGQYRGTIPAFVPVTGNATVSTLISCPGGGTNTTAFTIYIDPSGTVMDAAGNPVTGATVTLLRGDTATGPFTQVPDGAAVMRPSNRANPMVTASDGLFHWDVIAGYYQIQATKSGCTAHNSTELAATSPVLEIPPPAVNLSLVMDCDQSAVPGSYVQLTPTRIVDTRTGLGFSGRVAAGQAISVQVAGQGGVPTTGVSALVANVTVTEPSSEGNISVYPTGVARPTVSNVNYVAGQSVPNLVTVPVGSDGRVVLSNNSVGSTQLIIDVAGYYVGGTPTAAGTFSSVVPERIVDTRAGLGFGGRLASGQAVAVRITGQGGIPASGVAAVVANVTVTEPSSEGNISVYPTGVARPTVSNVNYVAGQSVPNLVTVPVGADGNVIISNNSVGSTQVIVDVAGYYLAGTPTVAGAFAPVVPARIVDTRLGLGFGSRLNAGQAVPIQVTGRGGVPSSGVAAVVANVTVTEPTSEGNISVYPTGVARPNVSNVNYVAGQSVPNLVTVPVGADGRIVISNNSVGSTHVIVDVAGYFLG